MKKTPLYDWHIANGAKMAEFGSYMMPLWYPRGVKREHRWVISHCGLFDTSHMAVITLQGEEGRFLLQQAFSKDLERCIGRAATPLVAGRCVYGVFLNDQGHVIDDALVYQISDFFYMVVVNAGMGGTISEHLARLAASAGSAIEVTDMTDKLGKIDVQGPASADILAKLMANPDEVFADMPYFSFKGWFEPDGGNERVLLHDSTPILLSRTGYTGELGFEIFLAPRHLHQVWSDLLRTGEDSITPCGLAARDSLRTGAVLPLSHQDIGNWLFSANPWQFALPEKKGGRFSKSFIGAEQLLHPPHHHTYAFAGYDPRKITADKDTGVYDSSGTRIGDILTCTTDMAIDRHEKTIYSTASPEESGKPADFEPKGLSCGFVRVNQPLDFGAVVYLAAGKRRIPVEIRRDVRPDRTARRPLYQLMNQM